jgi:hypothetical protein
MKFLRSAVPAFGICFIFTVVLSYQAVGQPNNPPPPEDQPVPLTGVELLLLAGGAWGGFKLIRKEKSDR